MPRSLVDRVLDAFLDLTDAEIAQFAQRLYSRDHATADGLKQELENVEIY